MKVDVEREREKATWQGVRGVVTGRFQRQQSGC